MSDLALAIDIGGTRLRVALVDAAGAIFARASGPTDLAGGPAANVAALAALAETLGLAARRARVTRLGVAAPGPLDADAGVVIEIPTLPGWTSFPLRETLSAVFALPARLENDGVAAAFGEWRHGAGRGRENVVFVTVSTGIGGGVIADGRVLRGRRGMAGHVGHIALSDDGPRCACGAVGCFEALASGTALAAAGRARGLEDGPAIEAAARRGDAAARELMAREAEILGRGFATLAHVYSPERIVMGGGVAAAFDLLAPGIVAAFRRRALAPFRDVEIVAGELGDDAGLVGAAALARETEAALPRFAGDGGTRTS